MPDNRPLDDWGIPIGKAYKKKDWSELTPNEMMADFEWKSDVLAAYGEEISGATFYQDYLFRQLYNGEISPEYKVMLTVYDAEKGNKVHKVEVDEIEEYLNFDDVALSPCLFYCNWRRKKLLNYVSAFVLDIDRLRPLHLQRFFKLFDESRLLKPTFIANSGSGVHFYYLLDEMLPIDSVDNEVNNLIADEIYKKLYDDVKNKEKWKDAQRHWIGQDYRVVNSKTKFNQRSQIFKIGEIYTIEQLVEHYDISIDTDKRYASKSMIKYASNIAKDLKIEPPDFSNSSETGAFIRKNKDAAYQVREQRRKQRKEKEKNRKKAFSNPTTWYKNTLNYMKEHTTAGYRFSSMKALAAIANIEKVPRNDFVNDIKELAAYWAVYDWKGDNFNQNNVEAIIRYYDNAEKYTPSSETLEEWLGYSFRRVGSKRNGRTQADHLGRARAVQNFDDPEGLWRNKEGRPDKALIVKQWREAHPEGKKMDCERDTGLSRHTILKWWNGTPAEKPVKKGFSLGKKNDESKEIKQELLAKMMELSPDEQKELFDLLLKKE